ncbi:MAG: hypothetical protein ACRYGM_22075 [Janthinobacterium lividum]
MRHLVFTAILFSAFAAPALTAPAFAGEQDFKLVNKTGYQIDEVYVSTVNSKRWGNDVMGRGTLDEDAAVDITFNAPANACRWDLRVKYNDGDTAEWGNLNLCSIETVTLYWDRKNGITRAVTK